MIPRSVNNRPIGHTERTMNDVKVFAAPSAGDFVIFRWIKTDNAGVVSEKIRPAIILRVFEADRAGSFIRVSLVYGTTRGGPLQDTEFSIERARHPAEFARSGLYRDGRFDMLKLVTCGWTDQNFAIPKNPRFGETPKIGSIHPRTTERLKAAHLAAVDYGRLQNELLGRGIPRK